MKNEKGITLVVLVITVIILLILATVGITTGVSQLNITRLRGFYTKLEIAQEAIEKIAETEDTTGLGGNPTSEQNALIESLGYDSTNFKYFTTNQVRDVLDIQGVDLNLLVDFADKIVINPEGIEIDGTHHYLLESNKNRVQYIDRNTGAVDFSYQVSKYGTSYKIKITPTNVGNVKNGILKYKKSSANYWNVSENNEIVIKALGSYDILYTDANENSKQKTLSISLNNDVVSAVEINQ